MKLSKILSGFHKAQTQLREFISETNIANIKLAKTLKCNEADLLQAQTALTAINNIVGTK